MEQTQTSPPLAEPFSQIFVDRAEADWAFDLLRDTAKRLGIQGAYDPRFALTLARRSGRLGLHLNFGGWLVLGFHGPGVHSKDLTGTLRENLSGLPYRVDLALLASLVSWDERFSFFPFARKEGEPEVRSYHLPLDMVRPMTSDLQAVYETTLDFIAQKFQNWKRAVHWKQHNPEMAEALFKAEQRERVFAGLLNEAELRYERHLTAFYQDLSEEREEYEVGVEAEAEAKAEEIGDWGGVKSEYSLPGENIVHLNQEQSEIQYDAKKGLAKPFSQIFVDREEAEWAFDFLRETIKQLRIGHPSHPLFALTLPHKRRALRLNFGNWPIVEFKAPSSFLQHDRVQIVLIADIVDRIDKVRRLSASRLVQKDDEPEIRLYHLPIELLKPFANEWFEAYKETLNFIAYRFQNWQRSPYRKFHNQEIAEALFHPETSERLFREGLRKKPKGFTDFGDYEEINDKVEENNYTVELTLGYPLPQLAAETGFDEAELARWVRAIERKGQAILYGPPGTGKTFMAEKLAWHLAGGGDGFVEQVQFHPAYAYEDFMQGIRPESQGDHLTYPLKPGRFLEFCAKAQTRQDTCVLVIDEINRANLSRVFGELMYLLEYRDREIPLAGGGNFHIPANVRLIGTMNTADRSIALVDHALRRRFAFIALYPNYELLRRYHQQQQTGFPVEGLIETLKELNQQISDPNYAVGVTFFFNKQIATQFEDIWRMEIEPYLEEFFLDQEKVKRFRWTAIQQKVLP